LLGALPAVVRTRIGYCGGSTPSPTYRAISDYAETTQIEFDPAKTTYEELLREFFDGHNAFGFASKQYSSIIFYHSDAQKVAAEAALTACEKEHGRRPSTTIHPAGTFYTGEHYHSKYYLQRFPEMCDALLALEGQPGLRLISTDALGDSPILTKFNGYVGSNGTRADFEKDLLRFKIPDTLVPDLRRICRK